LAHRLSSRAILSARSRLVVHDQNDVFVAPDLLTHELLEKEIHHVAVQERGAKSVALARVTQ